MKSAKDEGYDTENTTHPTIWPKQNAYDRSINDAKRKINDLIKFKIPTQTM